MSQTPERFIDLTLALPAMGRPVLSAMTCKCFGPAYVLGIPDFEGKKQPKIVMSRGGYQAVALGDLHYQFLKPRHLRCMAHNLPVHLPKPTGFSNMSLAFTYSYS